MKFLFGHPLAIVMVLCVVGIFLFPVAAGPYSAVHGPATGLLAFRAAMKLRLAIALAAFCNLFVSVDSTLRRVPTFSSRSMLALHLDNLLNLRC
jgi:hypothetical protein